LAIFAGLALALFAQYQTFADNADASEVKMKLNMSTRSKTASSTYSPEKTAPTPNERS
jgi:hypothetical protein